MGMNMKVQDSRNGKALGIGELLASACSANAPLERSYGYHTSEGARRLSSRSAGGVQIVDLCRVAAANNKI